MIDRFHVLGVEVDAFTPETLLEYFDKRLQNGYRSIISNHNMHSIYLYHNDPKMKAFCRRSDRIIVDGMSVIFAAKLQKIPLDSTHRIPWTDFIFPFMAAAANKGWRVFFLGSTPGVGNQAGKEFQALHPSLLYQCRHGYFNTRKDGTENQQIIEEINAFRPNVLLVGMGMPRQEHWLEENLHDLNCNIVCNIGACMDFVTGKKSLPPRWLGRYGLEWAYRLAREPIRLSRRYLIEPWYLLRHLKKQIAAKKVRK